MSNTRSQIFADVGVGNYISALNALSRLIHSGDERDDERRNVWNEFMLGEHSLLLRAVRQWLHSDRPNAVIEARQKIIELFGRTVGVYDPSAPLCVTDMESPAWVIHADFDPVNPSGAVYLWKARLSVLDALLEPGQPPFTQHRDPAEAAGDKESAFDRLYDLASTAVHAYSDGWAIKNETHFAPDDLRPVAIIDEKKCLGPAFVRRLPGRWTKVIEKLAADSRFGWYHPGVAAVGETVAWLYSNEVADRPPSDWRCPSAEADMSVCTKVALASHRSHYGRSLPVGLFADLTVERIPGGCGLVYPDPISTGLRCTDHGFQEGIRNAWHAAFQEDPTCPYDFRWSLKIDALSGSRQQLPLSGRSGEVAFACALRAALRGEPLDSQVVVSASFREPRTKNFGLTKVGSIDSKVLADQLSFDGLQGRWLTEGVKTILVAQDQPELTRDDDGKAQPTQAVGGPILLDPVADFDAAYDKLGRHARMTADVRKGLYKRSQELLEYLCSPYCPNPMYVRESPSESAAKTESRYPEQKNLQEERRITDDEVASILRGDGYQGRKRIFITADSGFGKSTLLLCVENQLAQDRSGLIPIRLGAGPGLLKTHGSEKQVLTLDPLSIINWSLGKKAVLKQIVDLAVKPFLSARDAKDGDLIYRWFEQSVEQGRVLFLFDALDQTTTEMDGLRSFLLLNDMDLNETTWSILLTGRPESLESKMPLRRLTWDHFRLRGLGLDDVRDYLEDVMKTLPAAWFENWGTANHSWEPILQVPILLHQIRALARDRGVGHLKNREAVYNATIEKLFQRGEETLEETAARTSMNWVDFRKVLSEIAWNTIFRPRKNDDGETVYDINMTGVLSGEAYRDLNLSYFERYRFDLMTILKQVNIISSRALIQGARNDSLTWRHLSFCEYFAAQRLVAMSSKERRDFISRHGCHPQLGWLLRFAVGIADRDHNKSVLNDLAELLLRSALPYTLWTYIDEDRVKVLEPFNRLCRWLVQHDEEGRGAWSDEWQPPDLNTATLNILDGLFTAANRDSRWLSAAWELIADTSEPGAHAIRERFLSEFHELVMAEKRKLQGTSLDERRASPILQLLPDEELLRIEMLKPNEYHQLPVEKRMYPRCPRDPQDDFKPFAMGTPGENYDENLHYVRVTPFSMQRGLVTNEQFDLFDSFHRNYRDNYRGKFSAYLEEDGYRGRDNGPVHNVSWYMAQIFAIWVDGYFFARRREHGSTESVPSVRLPTEAEWEYACRGGRKNTHYGVGDRRSLTEEDANIGPYQFHTTSTGEYSPNDWGLYDLHGNLQEWCRDWYCRDYSHAIEMAQLDPLGPLSGSDRVLRGGSFRDDAYGCRAAKRYHLKPVNRASDVGFRLLLSSGFLRPRPSSA
jgi:formylglycine-generating enzyme required for sulfatase activity